MEIAAGLFALMAIVGFVGGNGETLLVGLVGFVVCATLLGW